MNNKDIKKIILTSPIWKYRRVLDICNEQSKQGYQLEKIRVFGKSTFIKDESKIYIYEVDFNMVIFKKGKQRDDYLEMFKEQGWEFVDNTFNGFSIFRKEYNKENSDEDYKIYTDKESTEEFYRRIENLLKIIRVMIIPIEVFFMGMGTIFYSLGSNLSIIEGLIMFLTIMIISCLPIILLLTFGIKSIEKIKNK